MLLAQACVCPTLLASDVQPLPLGVVHLRTLPPRARARLPHSSPRRGCSYPQKTSNIRSDGLQKEENVARRKCAMVYGVYGAHGLLGAQRRGRNKQFRSVAKYGESDMLGPSRGFVCCIDQTACSLRSSRECWCCQRLAARRRRRVTSRLGCWSVSGCAEQPGRVSGGISRHLGYKSWTAIASSRSVQRTHYLPPWRMTGCARHELNVCWKMDNIGPLLSSIPTSRLQRGDVAICSIVFKKSLGT